MIEWNVLKEKLFKYLGQVRKGLYLSEIITQRGEKAFIITTRPLGEFLGTWDGTLRTSEKIE